MSAVAACAWQGAYAQTSPQSAEESAEPTQADATLPNILVVGDTQHLPQSFDQRYASTQVLTRADLDRLDP
ncbi:TonB-dependent receptor, partial [Paraburkholderia sp. SIMBA_049]